MTQPPRIHWQQLIAQIRATGKSYTQVSIKTEIPRTTLKSLGKKGQPMHMHGEILIAYWCARMRLGRDCLPQIVDEPSSITACEDDQAA
jgi:lambda repressor-like predicted transcriptional regulator